MPAPPSTTTALALLAALLLLFLARRRPRARLPPGPRAGLLGDHRARVPATQPWVAFAAWAREYKSPVVSFYLGRTPNIVLNDMQTATDLLDRRGEIYSSRPRNIMGQEILSDNMRGLAMAYGPRYRQWRKFQHGGMAGKAAHAYVRVQELEAGVLVRELLGAPPGEVSVRLLRYATSVAFAISYGSRIRDLGEPVVRENSRAQMAFGKTTIPGRYIVESWPVLLWLPKPLQWFRHEQERTRALDAALYTRLLREVARKMERGAAQPCLSAHMLETVGKTGELSELQMAYNVSSSFSAGVHTVAATFDVFLLAMLHHPACAARAQAELDAVVGAARLPAHADARALPYLCALVKEVQRWRPIAPTGVAHAVTEDDTYAGYFIPKGATVYANIYAIAKDPAAFPEPEAFRPERFLGDAEGAPFDLPFGFGRRACPGRDVAFQSLLIVLARVLWVFDVRPAPPYVDPRTGHVDAGLPDADAFVGGLVSRPVPFGVRMVVRGEERRRVVEREAEAAEGELGAWE